MPTQEARSIGIRKSRTGFLRGLRFRLTLSYVLFFSVLLIAIGLLFQKTLQLGMDDDSRAALEEEWGAAKGYLHIEGGRPVWIADPTDPEEAYIVERLRHVYILADYNGKVLEHSQTYDSIGIDSPQEIARILNLPHAGDPRAPGCRRRPLHDQGRLRTRRQRTPVLFCPGPFHTRQRTHREQLHGRTISCCCRD